MNSMWRMKLRKYVTVPACSACSAVILAATIPSPAHAQKLGTISFPNSGNAAAQAPFIRGVLLYHSFEYADAATAFREAQKADPSFALAYWGEALTYTHQVWNEQNVEVARTALARLAPTPEARREKAKTPREKMFLDLAEALYGEGSKPRRDTLFNAAAERLSLANPADDEAKVLHAVGLLGLNQGVRDFTTYMQAGAIAEDVLRRNPDHPAAAHFVIHAFDDPVHAPLGLWAARAYSKIAPAAPHAQHMTTHIFVALGMWDDVISQNVIASGPDHDGWHAGHYTWWLGYGYLQAGRYADARSHLAMMRQHLGTTPRRGEAPALVMMRAHYVIDAERWSDDAATWKLGAPAGATAAVASDSFVAGYAALKRGERATAERIASYLTSRPGPGSDAGGAAAPDLRGVQVLGKELRAAILSATNRAGEAVTLATDAAAQEEAMPFEFGPPQIVKPTQELLGEILLSAGKPAAAQAAFTRSLARTPGRSRSLVGLARAASAAGDRATAEGAVAQLRSNWHAADKDLPELAELTRLIAARTP